MAKEDKDGKIIIVKQGATKKGKNYIIKINGKEIPEGVEKEDLVAGFICDSTKEEEKQAQEKDYKKKLILIPIILLIPLLILGKCTKDQISQVETIETPIVIEYYEVDNPALEAWEIIGNEGQEGMHQNEAEGHNVFKGPYYDWEEHAEKEEDVIEGHEEFKQYQEDIDNYMDVLKNPDATKEEKEEAIRRIYEISKKIEQMYEEKSEMVDEATEGFVDSATTNPDSRTDDEVGVAKSAKKDYYAELGLSSENVEAFEDLVNRMNNGEEIDIDTVVQSLDGDYVITGKSCKEVVQQEKVSGIKKIIQNIKNFFNKDRDNKDKTAESNER